MSERCNRVLGDFYFSGLLKWQTWVLPNPLCRGNGMIHWGKLRWNASFLRLTYYASRNILHHMISSFRDKDTRELYETGASRRFNAIARIALRKLDMIAAATQVETLRVPPGNHLESLTGDRQGQWSIRINGQWRICFKWNGSNAEGVEIVDYH